MKRQPIFNKLISQEVFQLSLHAVHANSQRTVFRINMPPSFLLWRIDYFIVAFSIMNDNSKVYGLIGSEINGYFVVVMCFKINQEDVDCLQTIN